MTIMNLICFLLGITTAFSVVGIIALKDWHAKSKYEKKAETEEEEELCLPPKKSKT